MNTKNQLLNNLNSESSDIKLEASVLLSKENFEQKELISFLASENYELKKLGVLKLEKIENRSDALILAKCLVDNPTEVREYTSFLINKLIREKEQNHLFQQDEILLIFERGLFDVNPKICRNTLEILQFIDNKNFLIEKLFKNIFELFENTTEKNKRRNHAYNRHVFKLYWNLFGLGILISVSNSLEKEQIKTLTKIIKKTTDYSEYTLREKGAFLLRALENNSKGHDSAELKDIFLNDENFYVRNCIKKY